MSDRDNGPVIVRLTPEQATELYDLACWALDGDRDHGDFYALHEGRDLNWSGVDQKSIKAAAAAIIEAGGSGHDYL